MKRGGKDCYLPFDMLVVALVANGCLVDVNDVQPAKIANWIGVARQTVYLWQTAGQLTFRSADLAATRMHVHPSEIWGKLYWQADLSIGVK
jgi:hypothetical protein